MQPAKQPLILEHQDVKTTETYDTTDGTTQCVQGTVETVTINPFTGTKTFAAHTTIVRTKDGRLIKNPARDDVHACIDCRTQPLSTSAVISCRSCARITCQRCAQRYENAAYCRHCYNKLRWKRLWEWLLQLH